MRYLMKLAAATFFLSFSVTSLYGQTTQPAAGEAGPKLGMVASLFATNPKGAANNANIMWAATGSYDHFEVARSKSPSGPFEKIYDGHGKSFNDNGLGDGTYYYQVIAWSGNDKLLSNIASISTIKSVDGLSIYTNQEAAKDKLPGEPPKAGDTYYRFQNVRENGAYSKTMMFTSKDGKSWSEGAVVMDKNSHPDFADCKFESEHTFYDKYHDQFCFWGHWERSKGYKDGKVAIAVAKPGQPFVVKHVMQPLGVEVRDMSQFIDDDRTGYFVAAANLPGKGANATLHIFKMNETYDDVTEIVARVVENGFREAPHIVKKDGFYYLVFSQAAGWYPSQGGYVSAKSLYGPWTGPRKIGNNSTFAAQSGAVVPFGEIDPKVSVMWGNRWLRGDGTSQNSVMPIQFANGFAFYDWSPMLMYDEAKSILVPLQMGELLSQDKPATSSIPAKADHEASAAFDGSYDTSFTSDNKQWPFTISVDLQRICNVRNIQISWLMAKGSEAYYTYTIEGSQDGKEWTKLVDHSDKTDKVQSKTYGFNSDVLPEKSMARYVRLNVLNAHLQNNPNNNWYAPTIYEIKIFGDAHAKQ